MKKESLRKLEIFFIIAFVFCTVFILNYYTQYTSDDYMYHYFFDYGMPHEETRVLESIWEIPKSMINHYNLWNGRVFVHGIIQFFMMFDKNIFNVFNTIIYIILGLIIYKHIFPCSKEYIPIWLLSIYILMWIFIPIFGQSVLWLSGSINYLWMAVIILAFLFPYRKHEYNYENKKDSLLMIILMFIFGFFAGASKENGSGAMIMMEIFFVIYWKYKKINIPKWSIVGIISSIIGLVFILVAPGNSKIETVPGANGIFSILTVISVYKNFIFIPFVIFIIAIFYIFISKKYNIHDFIIKFYISFIFVISAIASVGALLFSPIVAYRSAIFGVIFIIIAIGIAYSKLFEISKSKKNKTNYIYFIMLYYGFKCV